MEAEQYIGTITMICVMCDAFDDDNNNKRAINPVSPLVCCNVMSQIDQFKCTCEGVRREYEAGKS